MATCPACGADLVYLTHANVAPSAEQEFYHCPDPHCEVVNLAMVVAE